MNPTEWENLELETDAQERFQLTAPGAPNGQPIDRARRMLWGYSVTTSPTIAAGSAILGDFGGGGSIEIREREEIEVMWTQTGYVEDLYGEGLHGDLMEANKVRWRAEGRWGLAVKRPAAFIVVDLTA